MHNLQASSPFPMLAQARKDSIANVEQLARLLDANGDTSLRFALPSGQFVPAHFHVTEVGRVHKKFIDCGGTLRETVACSLQLWTASDLDHRLTAGKLAKILKLAEPVLESADLPVEVEYGPDLASHYLLAGAESSDDGLVLFLAGKQTDCLAQDKCGVNACASPDCCC